MPNRELRRQIGFVWEQFWHAGIDDPVEILEQILFLLFLRRLDDESPGMPAGAPRACLPRAGNLCGPDEEFLRWSAFRHLPDRAMFALLSDHVYPRLRVVGGPGPPDAPRQHGACLALPCAATLGNIVRLLDKLPRSSVPGAADPFDYVAAKLASVGRRGDISTPSAIGMLKPGEIATVIVAAAVEARCE
jgi:type I restriction enzyme M protein